jgi:hypothetical protein
VTRVHSLFLVGCELNCFGRSNSSRVTRD